MLKTASVKNQRLGYACSFGDTILMLLVSSVHLCSK